MQLLLMWWPRSPFFGPIELQSAICDVRSMDMVYDGLSILMFTLRGGERVVEGERERRRRREKEERRLFWMKGIFEIGRNAMLNGSGIVVVVRHHCNRSLSSNIVIAGYKSCPLSNKDSKLIVCAQRHEVARWSMHVRCTFISYTTNFLVEVPCIARQTRIIHNNNK